MAAITKNRKFSKKSPLKLLGQMSPNYCEMVISGPLSELCLVSTCNLHARLSLKVGLKKEKPYLLLGI
jgi:hypothetical protein